MTPRLSLLLVCLLLSTLHGLDQDADQISDVYAEHHGLASGSTDEDPDGDGLRNFEESAWGTDPFDRSSVFRPVSAQVAGGLYDFAIPTIPGKRYQFQGRPDLVAGSWIDIDLPFSGTGATEHLLTALPIAGTDKFFGEFAPFRRWTRTVTALTRSRKYCLALRTPIRTATPTKLVISPNSCRDSPPPRISTSIVTGCPMTGRPSMELIRPVRTMTATAGQISRSSQAGTTPTN